MSARIAILGPDVVNQIAAGEVVERPASVVKELLENAVDAQASRIDLEVEQGGQALVRVTDDGHGMTPEEARLSLERHATSKLRRTEDLLEIGSMGFRGEALPSIASVSRLRLTTRPREAEAGWVLEAEAGACAPGQPAGCRVGTTVEVADLFFNTPARLKFLKSTATETAHIADTVNQLALAHPGIHITLRVDGRVSADHPPCSDRLERARVVLGRRGGGLVAARYSDSAGIRVEAGLAPPEQSTRSSRSVHLVVNRRVIRDRSLVHAVVSGYDTALERGRFPLAVVHLDLDPALLDVNVHPRKVEVRFSEPGRLFAAVRRCVRDRVARGEWAGPGGAGAPVYQVQGAAQGYAEHRSRIEEATRRFWSARADARWVAEPDAATEYQDAGGEEQVGFFSGLRLVGQTLGTYLVCEAEDELVLVDQHAAHERVTFERLRAAAARGAVPSQGLLIPAELELDGKLAVVASERGGELARLGFELEPFGTGVWMVRAVPGWLAGADPAGLVRDVLEELGQGGASSDETRDALLARMACHASVRAGQSLEPDEVRALFRAMDRVEFAGNCPHGRPVMVRFSRAELERWFKR